MPLLDARPGHLDAYYRPGDPFTATLTGPAGWLDVRTFTATLDGVPLSVSEDGDNLVVTASPVVTAAATGAAGFVLSVAGDAVLVGLWVPRNDGSDHGDLAAAVIIDGISVDVTILGPTGTGGGGGGQVDQLAESTGIDVDSSNPAIPVISAAPAIATAAADATTKANAAQSAATATAATDATTKANAAEAAAISTASADATAKANAAQAAAVQRTNHTGTQAIATVTGLQTALDAKALATDLDTLEADVDTVEADLAAIPELVSADPTEVNLDTAGLVTTLTVEDSIARTADIAPDFVDATRPKVVGHYFLPFNGSVTAGSFTLSRLSFHPVWLRAGTIDRIGVEVTTAVATAVGRFGIYADNGSGEPGDLIAEAAGTQDLNVLGWAPVTIAAVLPTTARYHIAVVSQTAAGTVRVTTSGDPLATVTLGTSLPAANALVRISYHNSGVTGALPATAAAASYTNSHNPLFLLRYSA